MLRSALTIDASMTVQDALIALDTYPDNTDIVIRRREGSKIYWYAERVGNIRRIPIDLGSQSLAYSLKQALDLHEHGASENYQMEPSSRGGLEEAFGVLLDGEQVIGVLEPLPRRAAFHERRSTTAPPAFRREVRKPRGDREEQGTSEVQTIYPYPHLDAPDNVTPGQHFILTIGLSREQRAGVAGGPLAITTAEEEFDLVVQVVAQGFQAPDGIRRFLHVKRSRFQEAETKVGLIAPHVQDLLVSTLEVEFSYQGNLLGRA